MAIEEQLGEWSRPILLSHGARTKRVFVLLHGFTASPPQFAEFGRRLYERGANVLIPLLPRHGHADRMTDTLSELHNEELLQFAHATIVAARAHGENVVVVGFSLGGLLGLWLAQNARLERVVAIAPFLGVGFIPAVLSEWLTDVVLRMPNRFLFWDPFQREHLEPQHGYPRYPTHAIARFTRLSRRVVNEARTRPPKTHDIVLVMNASEISVSNRSIRRLAQILHGYPEVRVTTHCLRGLPLSHDIIEPLRAPKIVERIYPELIELADR